ncbi:zinc finger protein [Trichonephila inaurata madagascariensis]|uniref:Zinc finger protein n=1 Tax=Trichonephila inaurata madagascariensis TaxID=2747483 RepID=A0A8X6IHV9_9ARAC|nr:zinc finger protein [Trichonephila inaurata madagascariensis]
MEWQKCDVCNKSFTGIVPFKEHEASEKHKRKQSASKLNMFENSKADLKGYIKCFDCNKICNSPITYENHLQGKLHKKTIQRKHYNERNNSPVPSPNSALQNPMEWNSETLKNYYCDICKKQCGSRIPYELHVLSRAHCKKAGNAEESGSSSCSKLVETNSFSNTGEISPTNEVDSFSHSYSLLYLFSYHKDSKKDKGVELYFAERTHHKKRKHSSKDQTYETHFKCYRRCVDCDKIFTGPVPYEQHFQGKAHKKKIAKKNP